MLTETAEIIGVSSERSGEVLGRASTQGLAVNGTQSLCPEDSAIPSGCCDAVIVRFRATRSTASRKFKMEGKARMQVKFCGFAAKVSISARMKVACKNVPESSGAARQFS